MREIKVRVISGNSAEGELLVYPKPISFLGEVDPKRGIILVSGQDEVKIKDKILIFPGTRGSTVGSYVIYALKYYGNAPAAMVVHRAEPILIAGAVLAGITLAEGLSEVEMKEAMSYRRGEVDAQKGVLRMTL